MELIDGEVPALWGHVSKNLIRQTLILLLIAKTFVFAYCPASIFPLPFSHYFLRHLNIFALFTLL